MKYLVLAVAVLWFALAVPDPLGQAWERVQSHQPGAEWRFLACGLVMGLAVASLLGWTRARTVALGAAVVCLFAAAAESVGGGVLDPDEMMHMHEAWLFGSGAVPYRDFVQAHQVAWPLCMAPIMHAVHDNLNVLVGLRGLELCILLLSLGLAALLARSLGGNGWVAAIFLLAVPAFIDGSVQFRPDPAAALALMAAMLTLARGRPGWAGLSCGVAVLLGQKSLIPVAVMMAVMAWFRPSWPWWRAFGGGFLAPIVVGFAWAAGRGLLRDYALFTYVFPFTFAHYLAQERSNRNFAWFEFKSELLQHPLFFAFCVAGLVLLWRDGRPEARRLALVTVGTVVLQIVFNLGYKHYILFPCLLCAVVASVAWQRLPSGTALVGASPAFVALLLAFVGLVRMAADPPPGLDLSRPALVLSHIPPQGTFFGDGPSAVLGQPIFRRDCGYYYASHQLEFGLLEHMGMGTEHPAEHFPPGTPDAMIIDDPAYLREVLGHLAVPYDDVGRNVWVRRPAAP